MNVGDLFQRLSLGELSGLAIGSEGEGDVQPEGKDRLVAYANSALTAIHSRFAQRIEFATIVLSSDLKRYRLNKLYAVSNTAVNNTAPRYIKDSVAEPFVEGVVRISAVTILELPEPEISLELETRLLGHDTIYINNPLTGVKILVEYQVNHPRLSIPFVESEEIILAPMLEEALETKVAAMVYSAMNGEAQVAKAQLLNARYEEICATIKGESLVQEASPVAHEKLGIGGWV